MSDSKSPRSAQPISSEGPSKKVGTDKKDKLQKLKRTDPASGKESAKRKIQSGNSKAELRREAKRRRMERKAREQPHFAILQEAKQVWERARLKQGLQEGERTNLIARLFDLTRSRLADLVFKHDASRLVQTMLKYGTTAQRREIHTALSGRLVELAKAHYGRFLAQKLFKYAPDQSARWTLIKELLVPGVVKRLLKHREASGLLEYIWYEVLRTPAQRFLLLRELYLPELALEPVSEWGRGGLRSVEELLQQRPEKKEAVLAQLQRRLQRLADKPDVMRHPLAHRLLLDYLSLETGLRPREELAAHLREAVPHMVHTWEGARASCLVAELLSAKERKALMKSLKGLVVKIAREEHAHLFLLRLLDIVDDTVLSSRLLLQEILREPLPPLLQDRFASRVFLNLLAPASQTHFDESSRAVLQAPGPWVAYPEAVGRPKKDAQLRRSELLRHLLPALIDQLASASDTTTASLLRSLPASAVLTELLRHLLQPPEATSSSGGSAESSAEEEFSLKDLELLIARLVAVLEADQSLLEDKVASRCFKRLIHIFATAKKTRPAVPDLPARLLQSSALHGRLAHWVSRPGAGFVICAFLECEDPAVQKLALQELKPQLETLRNQQNASPAVPLIIAHLSGGKKTADRSAPDGKKSAPVSKKQKNDS